MLRIALLFSLLFPSAHAIENNFAQWNAINVQGKIGENWGWFFETQTRVARPNDVSNGSRLLLRSSVRYLPWGNGDFQWHLGYAWTPSFSPNRVENRIWQQVIRQNDGDRWWWAGRLRLEERWIEFTHKAAFRSRVMGRIHRYLTDDRKIGVSFWDEFFWNLNNVPNGPKNGFDQNRAFIGPHILLSPNARFETGYLNVYTGKGRGYHDLMTHTYAMYVYLDF